MWREAGGAASVADSSSSSLESSLSSSFESSEPELDSSLPEVSSLEPSSSTRFLLPCFFFVPCTFTSSALEKLKPRLGGLGEIELDVGAGIIAGLGGTIFSSFSSLTSRTLASKGDWGGGLAKGDFIISSAIKPDMKPELE
jgi:hypothetical protein